MKKFIATLLTWGPLGAALLAFLDGLGVPLPMGVDFVLISLSASHPQQAWWYALISIVSSIAGTLVLYYLAKTGGQAYLERHTQSARGQRFRSWFQHYGLITVFIPALLPFPPLPMKLFVICAGALGVRPVTFLLVLLAARIPRYFTLAYMGARLGDHAWDYVKSHAGQISLAALLLCATLFLVIALMDRWRRERTQEEVSSLT